MSQEDPPVYVIEKIPVGGENKVPAERVAAEKIPMPTGLLVYPEMARGGMGRIHPATDRSLLRHVALKRLDAARAKVPLYREGFIAEAQITGQLEHPNIIPVHELGVSGEGVPYFTMKLVRGGSLYDWLKSPKRRPGSGERLEKGLEIFVKVCDACAYAHHRGVIHRDFKPENIMVADFGQVYLMDWGFAKLSKTRPASGAKSQMEATGAIGTPSHMAPEQGRGVPGEMDERSDIFGLGAVLYEIATGETPYGDVGLTQLMERVRAGRTIPVVEAAPKLQLAGALCAIIDKACAPDPDQRYQTVTELRDDVARFLRGGLHLPRMNVEAGTAIVREGEPGDTAYMIVSGTCRAYRSVDGRQEPLAEMGPGDVFGEMALLLDDPRAATVEAVTDMTVLVLDRSTVDGGLGVDGWVSSLVKALATRFRDLEHRVRKSGLERH